MDAAGSVSTFHLTEREKKKSPAVARDVPLHETRVLLIGWPAVEKQCLFSL